MADIHVEFDGGLWIGDEADDSCRFRVDIPVSGFAADPSAWLGRPVPRVHVSGRRINAVLVSLSGGCPWKVWRPAGATDAASQIRLRMSGRATMVGLRGFDVTDSDRRHYGCLARNAFVAHPLGLALQFLAGCRSGASDRSVESHAAAVAGFILDPRWWFSPNRPSRWSALFRAVAEKPGVVSLLEAWGGRADAVGLRKRYRKRGLDVLALLFWHWRCSQADSLSPFDPAYFFEDGKTSAAFCEFIRKAAFDGGGLPPRIEPT